MSGVPATNFQNLAASIDLGPSGSLQFMFAKLQLALSQMSKSSAMNYMDEIQKSQDEQKQVSAFLQTARDLQAKAGSSDAAQKKLNKAATGSDNRTLMPLDMLNYLKANNLAYDKTGDERNQSKDEWELAVTSLKAQLEQLGTNTQQKMVFVQDFMGQYNSYLQGATSAIQQSNQTLAELARTR
jgi:hypothetical protein